MLTLQDNNNPPASERNQSLQAYSPPNMGLSERLMNAKIVRIHPGTTCAFVKSCHKLIFISIQ